MISKIIKVTPMIKTEIRVKMKLQFHDVYLFAFKLNSLLDKTLNLHFYRLQRFY